MASIPLEYPPPNKGFPRYYISLLWIKSFFTCSPRLMRNTNPIPFWKVFIIVNLNGSLVVTNFYSRKLYGNAWEDNYTLFNFIMIEENIVLWFPEMTRYCDISWCKASSEPPTKYISSPLPPKKHTDKGTKSYYKQETSQTVETSIWFTMLPSFWES